MATIARDASLPQNPTATTSLNTHLQLSQPPNVHLTSVGPCEACTFKDGQIFALVQILHPFHRGQLTNNAELSQPSKKVTTSKLLFSTVTLKQTSQGLRNFQRAKCLKRSASGRKLQDAQRSQSSEHPIGLVLTRTRSGRESKATQKILSAAL